MSVRLRTVARALVALATVAYPFVVYLGLGRWNPVWIALALAGLLFLRAWSARDPVWLAAGCGALVLGAATQLEGNWLPLKLYPLMVSGVLLVVFAVSLWKPPSVIERIARVREPQLPASGVAYTRKVTLAWCIFFACNGLISAATALWGSDATWALYNGLLSYGLVGAFFGAEWLLRRRLRARLQAGCHG